MSDAPFFATSVFIVDTARCTGCQTCVIACKDRANLPDEVDWIRVERQEAGVYPKPTLLFRVIHCFHCRQPSCVETCPTGAMALNTEGWVTFREQDCIQCGACAHACPFGAITLRDGVPTKCDGCADEIAQGGEPTCVRACPMRALGFGPPTTLGRPRIADPTWQGAGIGERILYLTRPSSLGKEDVHARSTGTTAPLG